MTDPTLLVHSINADELPTFTSTAAQPDHIADQAGYLERMIAGGSMRPEWCYLAVQAGVPVARLALWTLPKVGTPLSIVLLDVAPDGVDRTAVALAVLARAIDDALATNTSELGYVIDEPSQTPQWQTGPEERAGWLGAAGFQVVRATSRWSFDGPPPATTERLRFSAFEEVGEGVFLDALERVSVGTLDARVRADRDRLGPVGEARETLADLRSMEWRPGWWELAFDADGALVGLTIPTRAPSFTTIGYIGVVPEQRGRGYVDDLLARGTATLRRAVPDLQIRADTDVANVPMAAAFERAGYQRFASRREFEYPIDQSTGRTRIDLLPEPAEGRT